MDSRAYHLAVAKCSAARLQHDAESRVASRRVAIRGIATRWVVHNFGEYAHNCQSRTFAQPLANPVDPILTASDWYYIIIVLAIASWRQCLFCRVASHGVSLLPLHDTK